MNTIIVHADNKVTKALITILEAFKVSFELKKENKTEESTYDPEFVKMVLKRTESVKQGETIEVNPSDLWGSLGLK